MPLPSFRYNRSTLDPDYYIDTLNGEIADFCAAHPGMKEEEKKSMLSRLLRRACMAAFQGVSRREGGPFGAMLVDLGTAGGIPKVVGFGTNHVVPQSDPSAHAEMTAIRDAAKRLGRTDLSGLSLLTSCECCPMCLAAATGCKIDNVYFAADRHDAANVGFTDAAQYKLMRSGGLEKHAEKAHDPRLADTILDGHDAVVIVRTPAGKQYFYGDENIASENDPTALPTVQAIRHACKALGSFHLPEDTVVIARHQPHPLSLIVSAWARIGAVRDPQCPNDPAKDHPNKDATKIRYITDEWEQMEITRDGVSSAVPAKKVWEEIHTPSAQQLGDDLGRARLIAFQKWDAVVNNNQMPRY